MRTGILATITVVVTVGCSSSSSDPPTVAPAPDPPSPIPTGSTELVTVVSASWDAVPAVLHRYERSGAVWSPIGEPIPVVLGKTGLGWGIGLHAAEDAVDGPEKHEGDGRSPAGVFSVGTAFGYAPAAEASWLSLPYLPAADDDLECVDDPASSHYNQLLYRSSVATVDWTSSETMKRPDALYRWGVFVGHNPGPVKNGGSCIFLHLWSGPGSATVGCTAGAEDRMKELFGWLDPRKTPVIVQLPQASYDALRQRWQLP